MTEPEINNLIQNCQACSRICSSLKKTAVTERGQSPKIMIVGRNPGNKETENNRAFGGLAGTRLDQWLVECGNATTNPREHMYLTSAIKCFCGPKKAIYKQMATNCSGILREQVALHEPELIISLGEDSYEAIKFIGLDFSEAVFNYYNSTDHVILTALDRHFIHLVWPHPSPLSRMLNSQENMDRLRETFPLVRQYLED